jgi:hypothetical protein
MNGTTSPSALQSELLLRNHFPKNVSPVFLIGPGRCVHQRDQKRHQPSASSLLYPWLPPVPTARRERVRGKALYSTLSSPSVFFLTTENVCPKIDRGLVPF